MAFLFACSQLFYREILPGLWYIILAERQKARTANFGHGANAGSSPAAAEGQLGLVGENGAFKTVLCIWPGSSRVE